MGEALPSTDDARPVSIERIKHLEMIQAVIARLAGNSFLIKGWTLTVSAALYGFAVRQPAWGLAAIGITISGMFWVLDSFYLRGERMHRCLYDDVRLAGSTIPAFSLDTREYRVTISRRKTFFSFTLTTFYLMPIGVGAIVGVLAR